MNNTLRDFLDNRRSELRKLIDEQQSEVAELELRYKTAKGILAAMSLELGELDLAEKAIASTKSSGDISSGPNIRRRVRFKKKFRTIQDLALAVLAEQPNGADALKIIELIKERFGVEVPRTSMSPQLSRLKRQGKIALNNMIWTITDPVLSKDETPSEDQSESASNNTGEVDASPYESQRSYDLRG